MSRSRRTKHHTSPAQGLTAQVGRLLFSTAAAPFMLLIRIRLSKQSGICPDRERLVREYTRVALAFSEIDEALRQARERATPDACLARKHEQAGRAADEAWLTLDAHLTVHRCGGSFSQ